MAQSEAVLPAAEAEGLHGTATAQFCFADGRWMWLGVLSRTGLHEQGGIWRGPTGGHMAARALSGDREECCPVSPRGIQAPKEASNPTPTSSLQAPP